MARSSYVWQDYDQRSALERVNSRLAGSFGIEHPFIRGLAKMRLRMTTALTVMLAMALGRIQADQAEHLRSLVKSALLPAARRPPPDRPTPPASQRDRYIP